MDRELLKRYLNNSTSQEEENIIKAWLIAPQNREEVLDFIEAAWKEGKVEDARIASFNGLFEKALREENEQNKVVPISGYSRKWVWTAACALFLLGGTWLGYQLKDRLNGPGASSTKGWELSSAYTGKGERTRLFLSDGSEVYLNADSRISFSKKTEVQPVLYLEGEAYFNLKSAQTPLIIKTKEIITKVNGSKVNISAFPKDNKVTISVEKGKAEVSSNEESPHFFKLRFPSDSLEKESRKMTEEAPKILPLVKLRPAIVKENQSMVFDKASMTGGVTDRTSGDQSFAGWKDGVLSFTNADSAHLVDKLERWFGVRVNLNMNVPLAYNGEFRNAVLNDVLQHICESINAYYIIKDNSVYINRKGY